MKRLTRRQFVASGVAAGVMTSLPAGSFGASRYRSANDSVNIGMISCGGRAGGLADQFSKLDGVRIAGLCDPDPNRFC